MRVVREPVGGGVLGGFGLDLPRCGDQTGGDMRDQRRGDIGGEVTQLVLSGPIWNWGTEPDERPGMTDL